MHTLINNKIFDEEEDLDSILEVAEFDVEEMMDSPSLIEDDGSQERTGVVKAPTPNAFSTGGWQCVRGSIGELRGGGPCHAPSHYIPHESYAEFKIDAVYASSKKLVRHAR